MMSRIALFGQISEINDHLYLSGAGVLTAEKIKQKKIKCIVNATTEEPSAYQTGVDYIKIRIEDNPNAPLNSYFDMVADKIKATKDRGGKTLVHCVAGVSRSATLVIVYLMKYERMNLRQAYEYVKAKRPIIRPNVGFWKQMVAYEKKIKKSNSVSMIYTEHCDLPIPDVYINDLKKHIINKGEDQRKKPLANFSDYTKRRGYSSSVGNSIGSRRGTSPSLTYASRYNYAQPFHHTSSFSLLSPAPNRRNRQENIFGSIYNSGRSLFYPAF
uniref:Protein-tyrosine-phosphatase n=1 Tax=Parastrongyloides trichosuri TaxID=131310 RepID=A0A0N4ZUD4_PARTI